jgi:hypothetical protein
MTGVGKTTLGVILARQVGYHNASFPSAEYVLNTPYTDWAAFKRLVVVAEIYAGHSAKAFNTIKTVITDNPLYAHEKFHKPYSLDNWTHLAGSSNDPRALKIDDYDRRFIVPEVTEKILPLEKATEFYKWLDNGGDEIVAYWAQEYVKEHNVKTGEHAPMTAAKRHVIEENYNEGERIVCTWGKYVASLAAASEHKPARKIVVRLDEIRKWLAIKKASADERTHGRDGMKWLETPQRISAILKGCGLYVPKRQYTEAGKNFRVVSTFSEIDERWNWETLKEQCEFKTPTEVEPL